TQLPKSDFGSEFLKPPDRSGSEVSRTIARRGLACPRNTSHTAPPTFPVAPTTRFICPPPCAGRSEYRAGRTARQGHESAARSPSQPERTLAVFDYQGMAFTCESTTN